MVIRRAFPQVYQMKHPKTGVYWQVSERKYGMKRRKTFHSKSLALKHAADIEEQFLKHGAQTDVPKEKVVMAENFEKLAKKVGVHGVTLDTAVEEYMRFKGEEVAKATKPFIRELVEKWKAFKYTKPGMSKRFQTEIRSYARFINNRWGDLKPDDVKKHEIEVMLNKMDVCNNTRRKYLLIIRMFFKWLVDEGHLVKKPTDGIRITPDGYKGDCYTPAETKKLLRYIAENHKELIGYYALLTFAGLRPTEGRRVQWEDFNFNPEQPQLHVREGKTHARFVTLEPVALAWVQYHRQNVGKDAPFVNVKTLNYRERIIRQAALGKWVQDGLRHGFGTYYKALTTNIEKVADQMGNSITIAKKHYARAISAYDCKAFWDLTPEKVMANEPESKPAPHYAVVVEVSGASGSKSDPSSAGGYRGGPTIVSSLVPRQSCCF